MKEKNILLVSDMDGTLLNPDHLIDKKNIDCINEFISRGGCFTLATGREWNALGMYVDQLPLYLPLILVNGAQIYDPVARRVIEQKILPGKSSQLFDEIAKKHPKLGIIAVSDKGAKVLKQPENRAVMPDFYAIYNTYSLQEMPDNIYKMLLVGSADQLQIPQEYINRHFNGQLATTCSYPTLLDIMAAGVSKGAALELLKTKLPSDCLKNRIIIAVGDQENDIELFRAADYSFAMGQASEHVKRFANEILPSNDSAYMPYLLERIAELKLS